MKQPQKKASGKSVKPTAKPAAKAPAKPAEKPASKPAEKAAPVIRPKTAPAAKHGRSGLGKGLGALIDAPAASAVPRSPIAPIAAIPPPKQVSERLAGSVLTVPVGDVNRSPWQPRQTFDETALRELADSIRANGIIQPLVCRRRGDGALELIGGERRLRASVMAGLTHVPVILIDAEDRKAAELAIIENIQRADLNAIEEAEGYRTLGERFHLTQAEVAERVGKARTSVTNALRLLELPDETKAMVADGRLSAGHAKALLGLENPEDRIRLGRRAVAECLSVRSVERMVAAANTPAQPPRPARQDIPPEHLRDLCDRLHAFFGTAIRLTSGKTFSNGRHVHGTLEVDFYNNDELDRILSLLGIRLD